MIKSSGSRREFETGAVRDIAEGKGRCDLLPLGVISEMTGSNIFQNIEEYIREGNILALYRAITEFRIEKGWDIWTALLEVSKQYEDGCNKYGDRNWEMGMPLHCYIDSGIRHYLKWRRGDRDEPHDRAFLWNILGALWTQQNKPELIDLPFKED